MLNMAIGEWNVETDENNKHWIIQFVWFFLAFLHNSIGNRNGRNGWRIWTLHSPMANERFPFSQAETYPKNKQACRITFSHFVFNCNNILILLNTSTQNAFASDWCCYPCEILVSFEHTAWVPSKMRLYNKNAKHFHLKCVFVFFCRALSGGILHIKKQFVAILACVWLHVDTLAYYWAIWKHTYHTRSRFGGTINMQKA